MMLGLACAKIPSKAKSIQFLHPLLSHVPNISCVLLRVYPCCQWLVIFKFTWYFAIPIQVMIPFQSFIHFIPFDPETKKKLFK